MVAFATALLALASPAPRSGCITSQNVDNMQYVFNLSLGVPYQTVRAIPDSGSSELVVLGKEARCTCSPCTSSEKEAITGRAKRGTHLSHEAQQRSLRRVDANGRAKGMEMHYWADEDCNAGHMSFDPRSSNSSKVSGLEIEMDYGQGQVIATVAEDTVDLGGRIASQQRMALMRSVGLKNFGSASFDAILGLGLLEESLGEAKGSLLSKVGASMFSICLDARDGRPSRLQIGHEIPAGSPYNYVPIIGHSTWSLPFAGISVPGSRGSSGGQCSGGGASGCVALVDSGTSLISIPSEMFGELKRQMPEIREDCSNIHELPTLKLKIGSQTYDLPPHAYVIKMAGLLQSRLTWSMSPFEIDSPSTNLQKLSCTDRKSVV